METQHTTDRSTVRREPSLQFNNPKVPWSEVERIASGRAPVLGDGNDSPAWSRKREGYTGAPADLRDQRSRDDGGDRLRAPYAELHVYSNFSFLDGASHPEALVEEAARLELDALVLTDHDGLYGAVRFNDAARELGVRVGFGAELSLDLPAPQAGEPDPVGSHLLLLARQQEGYHRLCRVISHAQIAGGEKGRPLYNLEEVVDELAGHVVVLTGCRKGPVRRALAQHGPTAARAELARLVDWFGHAHVAVELINHRQPLDDAANDLLDGLARDLQLPTVVSNNVHYATPAEAPVADAVAAVRARRSGEELEGWRPPSGQAFLRSGMEQRRRFERRYPGAVDRAAVLGVEVAFDLQLVAPDLPPFDVPARHDEMSFLAEVPDVHFAESHCSSITRSAAHERAARANP